MLLNIYQKEARKFAIYQNEIQPYIEPVNDYPFLGLASEAGEVLGKLKKFYRDHRDLPELEEELKEELGDVLWYISNIASDFNMSLEDIAEYNIKKLQSRKDRGVIHGSGDHR